MPPAAAQREADAKDGETLPDEDVTFMVESLKTMLRMCLLAVICRSAYSIRLYAVREYGRVIHEFDPWFNFRATQYLVDHGYEKFCNWFDDKSWYPLGRHVGSTVYPGMMVTSGFIYRTLPQLGYPMSLNDVCVFVPAWFSVITTLGTYLLTFEISRDSNASVVAAGIMAIVPAHLMRSVAGGYDNESIAIAAIVVTFYLWVRSLRSSWSWPIGALCGVSYIYMVAAWGGYVFVLNMIGLHAGVLCLSGRFTPRLHHAYTLFYIIGTAGAVQFPIVGWQPLQSMEQLGPLGVLGLLQLCLVLHLWRKFSGSTLSDADFEQFSRVAIVASGVATLMLAPMVLPEGFIGPLSARVRGLFVRHTRTGNPLVDSVAEHQATPSRVYYQYFHCIFYLAPVGLWTICYDRTDSKWFAILYAVVAFYFSGKMIRLVLILAPVAAILGGIAAVYVVTWAFKNINESDEDMDERHKEMLGELERQRARLEKRRLQIIQYRELEAKKASSGKKPRSGDKAVKPKAMPAVEETNEWLQLKREHEMEFEQSGQMRQIMAGVLLVCCFLGLFTFVTHSHAMARGLSQPSIIVKARAENGTIVKYDDFREAYWWLRDNTPEDARVMAWWDYGYQIAGVGNRTTLADGNTWNHEHIALLGKCLVSNVTESHKIVRHLADYVLVWTTRYANMWGDDLAKSPHMARIAGSVYADIVAKDFWMDREGKVSPMMEESLLWQLHHFRLSPDVVNATALEGYEEAYTSSNKMVRIYKVLDTAPRHPVGSYPPALDAVLATRNDFQQIHGL